MIYLMIMFFMSILIPMILIIINYYLSMNKIYNREKITPFECGFDPMSSARLPFSIQFFTIALMFLIFDIEIMLIIPFIPLFKFYFSMYMILTFTLFILILLFSLWMEWSFNYIHWIN